MRSWPRRTPTTSESSPSRSKPWPLHPLTHATPVRLVRADPRNADTSWTAPTHVTALGSAGTAGTKIVQIDVSPPRNRRGGPVNVFAYDGTTYHLHESVTIAAGTISATVAPVKQTYYYDNLVLPSRAGPHGHRHRRRPTSLVEFNAFGASL